MFWIFLLLAVMFALCGYVICKEAEHHQAKELRTKIECLEQKHLEIVKSSEKNDPELVDYFKGELVGIDEALDIVKKTDEDYDLIKEVKTDLEKIKEKMVDKKP